MTDAPASGLGQLSEEEIDRLLDDLPAPTFRADPQGIIRYANAAGERLLKLRRSSLAGRRYDQPPLEVATPTGEPLDFDQSPVPRALRGETVSGFVAAVRLPGEAEFRIMAFDASPLHGNDGAIVGALVSASGA
jgi:PAS domain-containing protein